MPKIGTKGNLCANCGRSGIHNLEDCPTDPRNKITPKDLYISAVLVGQAVAGKLNIAQAIQAAEEVMVSRLLPGELASQNLQSPQPVKPLKTA